jgi:hypothetical protein
MTQDFPEASATFCHGFRASLTETDAMPLACALQDHCPVFLSCREIVAGYCIPSQAPVHREPSGFAVAEQALGILL